MNKYKIFLTVSFVFSVYGHLLTAQEVISKYGNAMTKTANINVKLGGDIVIAKDEFTTAAPLFKTEETKLELKSDDNKSVFNIVNTASKKIQFRKEVALHKDGSIELTSRFKVAPFQESHTVCHMYYLPMSLIKGCKFKALIGHKRTRIVTGKVGDPKWSRKLNQVHYVAFTGGKKDFIIDFNPYGVTDWMSYPKWGCPIGNWKTAARGGFLTFWYGRRGSYYGGTFAGKIVIKEGQWDFEKRHPYQNASYYGAKKPIRRFAFGSMREGFIVADNKQYTPGKKWGWEKPQKLKVVSSDKPGIINNCVSAPEGTANKFLMDLIPGYYIFTLRFANPNENSGPFTVALNDGKKQNVIVAKGKTKTVLLKGFLKDGKARISFAGKSWCINSIAAQAVIYKAEDFFINRKMWNTAGLPDFD